MSWNSSYTGISPIANWEWNGTYSGISRSSNVPLTTASLSYTYTSKNFSQEKTYLFKTLVNNFDYLGSTNFLEIKSPWGEIFTYSYHSTESISTLPISNDTNVTLCFYSNTSYNLTNIELVKYYSTYVGFGSSQIKNFELIEFDWRIQGWSIATSSNFDYKYEGWRYDNINNSQSKVNILIQNVINNTKDLYLNCGYLYNQNNANELIYKYSTKIDFSRAISSMFL